MSGTSFADKPRGPRENPSGAASIHPVPRAKPPPRVGQPRSGPAVFPKRPRLSGWSILAGLMAVLVSLLTFCHKGWADQPRISLIEKYLTNQVLIHFDTEAGHTYELQYTAKF